MKIKTEIKPNEELYGDFIPMPIRKKPVQQRIDFFIDKVKKILKTKNYKPEDLNKFIKARDFWTEIREKHCTNNPDKISIEPVLYIYRNISRLERMMEIILSMPKPQVKYIINNDGFNSELLLHAKNKNGICTYRHHSIIDEKDLIPLKNLPKEYFKEVFV